MLFKLWIYFEQKLWIKCHSFAVQEMHYSRIIVATNYIESAAVWTRLSGAPVRETFTIQSFMEHNARSSSLEPTKFVEQTIIGEDEIKFISVTRLSSKYSVWIVSPWPWRPDAHQKQ